MRQTLNKSSESQIKEHLLRCSPRFTPSLDTYVDIPSYSKKIHQHAAKFEVFEYIDLVGLIAMYTDPTTQVGFITNVSVERDGISKELMSSCIQHAWSSGLTKVRLEVHRDNLRAIRFYQKSGFTSVKQTKNNLIMELNKARDYNREFRDTTSHKYVYSFDFDVMHPYMLESFKYHFQEGSCLELGSFKGDFTKRLLPYFNDITCVEASSEAIVCAKKELGEKVTLINALFEEANLPRKYDNIILTHVLEHIDDPIALLSKIKTEWLSDNGKLFLVCPNANAPSRQIAVKMGLISHNSAITTAETEHGHRVTYSLDTLERDARAGGLQVVHRSGIFFKALANFQWDRLLQTDIIDRKYLDGCYQLGQQYPDLCSSIMLVCKK